MGIMKFLRVLRGATLERGMRNRNDERTLRPGFDRLKFNVVKVDAMLIFSEIEKHADIELYSNRNSFQPESSNEKRSVPSVCSLKLSVMEEIIQNYTPTGSSRLKINENLKFSHSSF